MNLFLALVAAYWPSWWRHGRNSHLKNLINGSSGIGIQINIVSGQICLGGVYIEKLLSAVNILG